MDQHFILTIISDDKPGIVKQIAKTISENKGNWLESQLSQLAGKFAGVIRLSTPKENVTELETALNALKSSNIHIQLESLTTKISSSSKRFARFTAAGPDRPGIVLEITQALTEYNINLESMNTKCSSMPYSGEPLFEAEGILNLPADTHIEQLMDKLEAIADQLGVDVTLEEDSL